MSSALERERTIEEALTNRETWLIVVEAAITLITVAIALIGNMMLCLAIYRFRTLRKIQNYYILSLAISDILITLLCVSLSSIAAILGRWPFGDTMCQIQGSLIYYFGSFSLFNMALIAINRYIKMVRSMNIYQKIYTRKNVLLSIAACGALSGVCIVPFLCAKFCFHPGTIACFECKSEDISSQALILASYAFVFLLTYPVINFCYYKVYRIVRVHFRQIASSGLYDNSSKSFGEEVRITKMLFAVLIAFLVCYTPGLIIAILETVQGQFTLPRQVYLILSFTAAAKGALNPLIYGLMQKRFRQAYKIILTCV